MKLIIDCDNTISIDRRSIADFLTSDEAMVLVSLPEKRFHYSGSAHVRHEVISHEFYQSYDLENSQIDAIILFTMTPYENNFFFEGSDKVYVVSMHGWNHLTRVEMDVGIVFMICSIVIRYVLNIGQSHDETTGCINDFWWDKTSIDSGMRAAFVCDACRSENSEIIKRSQAEFSFFNNILDCVSTAARGGKSILEAVPQKNSPETFDVFLCHNGEDKEAVRKLNAFLKGNGVKTWLDEEQVQPGDVWQEKLESAIGRVRACAIIVGDSGIGPWQRKELRAFISEFADKDALLIPVLIGSHQDVPQLPIFLRQYQYLDLRLDNFSDAYRLVHRLS